MRIEFSRPLQVYFEAYSLLCLSTAGLLRRDAIENQKFFFLNNNNNDWRQAPTQKYPKEKCFCWLFSQNSYLHGYRAVQRYAVSQLAFTCSKPTMETPEQYVKSVQKQQGNQNDFNDIFLATINVNFKHIWNIVLFPLLTLNK